MKYKLLLVLIATIHTCLGMDKFYVNTCSLNDQTVNVVSHYDWSKSIRFPPKDLSTILSGMNARGLSGIPTLDMRAFEDRIKQQEHLKMSYFNKHRGKFGFAAGVLAGVFSGAWSCSKNKAK